MNTNLCSCPFGFWRLSIWLKQSASSDASSGRLRGLNFGEGSCWVNMRAGVGMRHPTKFPLLPSFALPHFPCSMSLIRLPHLHHVTRKCGSPPFPLLTERKYCNRGGRRWALLRRWLKITGIFKAAEESQGRQRLDSLPPGRSSLSPLSLFLAHFLPLSSSTSKPISLHTSPETWPRPPPYPKTTFSYTRENPPPNYTTW